MDFTIVKRQIIGEYIDLYGNDRPQDTWSLEAVIDTFRYFYQRYIEIKGADHPNMTNKTIRRIIESFPSVADDPDLDIELSPEDYPALIDGYFEQNFHECNYSIAHFMSGQIRALRFYESLY